jgi:predicted RNA-binding protein with PUA-like domain
MSYWLVKSDPESYSIEDFRRDGSTVWDGVRNYQARNNMNLMKKGDSVLVYHSNKEKAVMGLAKVIAEAHQDPTTEDERWTAVDLALSEVFDKQPDLALIKKTKGLENIALIKQSRLSVMPLTKKEFDTIIKLTK